MGMPNGHDEFLRRGSFPIHPSANLDANEREVLSQFGYWLEALANGKISPATSEQMQFVCVANGEMDPQTTFEWVWIKHVQAVKGPPRVGAMELAGRFEELQAARAANALVREECDKRREAVMAQVKSQLDALNAEYAERLRYTGDEVSRLEAAAREGAIAFGASFRHAGIRAMFLRPRITWDNKGMMRYMESHPEVAEYRKVGKPSVSLRFDEGPDEPETEAATT
ncbi:MAG: DUF413 domain-containing protein [Gemmataceae bacterium]